MHLRYSEAADRNKALIAQVLREELGGARCNVLEVGSGTGQHATYFASLFGKVMWQCSDIDEYLPTLGARIAQAALDNLPPPIELDVNDFVEVSDVDIIFSANTLHIMSWDSVCAFMAATGRCLLVSGRLIVYGPFNVGGRPTSDSNAAFDASLRERDACMGIRGREQICFEANRAGLSLQRVVGMPANNQMLIFEKRLQ